MSKPGKKLLYGTRDVATGTRGDDPKSSAGRRQIEKSLERHCDHVNTPPRARTPPRAKTPPPEKGIEDPREKGRSAQMDGAPLMPENRKTLDRSGSKGTKSAWGPFEEKKRHRSKRCGYSHPAAQPSAGADLFYMPAGGISDSLARSLKKKVDPFQNDRSAGLDSNKMTSLACARTHAKLGYFPIKKNNPINHSAPALRGDNAWDDNMTAGAAGVCTERLQELTLHLGVAETSSNVLHHERLTKEKTTTQATSFDLIAHRGDTPPMPTTGKKRPEVQWCQKDEISIKHHGGPQEPMSLEAVNKWKSQKQVRTGAESRYNVAGHEDMLPAATLAYYKADRPPSRWHRRENDKKYLPGFYTSDEKRVKHEESEDLAYIMGRAKDPRMEPRERQMILSLGTSESEGRGFGGAAASFSRPRTARPSDGGRSSTRSVTPPKRFSPPTRSVESSVYSEDMEPRSRQQWANPDLVSYGSMSQAELDLPPMF